MANLKDLRVQGFVPFDLGRTEAGRRVLEQFGKMSFPSWGFWLAMDGTEKVFQLKKGGCYCYLQFEIGGAEAVRWEWIEAFYKDLVAADAEICSFYAIDMEGYTDDKFVSGPCRPDVEARNEKSMLVATEPAYRSGDRVINADGKELTCLGGDVKENAGA